MQVLIIEDEVLLANRLQKLLAVVMPEAQVTGKTHSVQESVEWLQTHTKPDLILMDIELADGQSFDIFKSVTVTSPVIFTTAYNEYAIKAFKINSIDYLLKPVKEDELTTAIEKFKLLNKPSLPDIDALLSNLKMIAKQQNFRNRFLVKQAQKLISIDVEDIAYFFSENGFSYLRTKQNQKYILDYTMDNLESMLSPKQFFRANRQHLISFYSVTAIHTWFNQKLKIEVKPELPEHIIISRDKAQSFKEWMGE